MKISFKKYNSNSMATNGTSAYYAGYTVYADGKAVGRITGSLGRRERKLFVGDKCEGFGNLAELKKVARELLAVKK